MALTLHGKAFETILVHKAVTDCAQRGVKAFGMCARQVLEVVRQLLFDHLALCLLLSAFV